MYDRRQRCYKETCIRPYLTSLRGELYEFWGIADFEKISYGHTCTKMKIIHTTTIEKKKTDSQTFSEPNKKCYTDKKCHAFRGTRPEKKKFPSA